MTDTNFSVRNGLSVNNGLIFANGGAVGINTKTPSANLTVNGNMLVVGNVTFSNTLLVTGAVTFSNQMSFSGNGNFSNTLSVTGAGTFSNTVSISGLLTTNSVNVTGAASVTGNTNVTGSLNVTNTCVFSNTLAVTGAGSFSNTLSVTGSGSFSNVLTVGTASYFVSNGNLGIGISTPGSKLSVNGTVSTITGITFDGTNGGSNTAYMYWGGGAYGANNSLVLNVPTGKGLELTVAGNDIGAYNSSGFNLLSLGIGTAPSGTTGEIRATNNITAYYSDERLKENIKPIEDALNKLLSITGVMYNSNDLAASFGYTDKSTQVGVLAQQIKKVLPMAVKAAPFDTDFINGREVSKSGENYLTVQYEKLIPLIIEAVKDLKKQVDELKRSN
jgi:Chaperone of endosialidase